MKNKFLIIPYCLFLLAFGMLLYRHFVLKSEFLPVITNDTWRIEATVDAPNFSKKVIKLNIPSVLTNSKIVQESYGQSVQGFTAFETNGIRTLVWSNNFSSSIIPEKAFNYSVVLRQGTTGVSIPENLPQLAVNLADEYPKFEQAKLNKFLRQLRQERKNIATELGKCFLSDQCITENTGIEKSLSTRKKTNLLVQILRENQIRAATARGFYPEKASKDTNFIYWVRASKDNKSYNLFLDSQITSGQQVLFWDFVDEVTQGESQDKLRYSILPDENYNFVQSQSNAVKSQFFDIISLSDLPASVQVVYRVMLLIPLGALLVAFFRIIVGVTVFGTFMPVLVALSFNQVGLQVGLTLLLVMIGAGLLFRGLMTKMRLLSVARVSCTLIFVIMLIAVISKISWSFNFVEGFSATLFPIIVISMIIERMSIMIEEAGMRSTVKNLINTIIMASLIHLVMSIPMIQYWTFTFWEFHIVTLGLLMLIGRYNGYRLSELFRFRHLIKKS